MSNAKLVVAHGDSAGLEVEINKTPFQIGRDASCNLVLSDSSVSREHATIIRKNTGYQIIDSSSNGTFVNETRVKQADLSNGDVVQFVDSRFTFSFIDEPQKSHRMTKAQPSREDVQSQMVDMASSQNNISSTFLSQVAQKMRNLKKGVEKGSGVARHHGAFTPQTSDDTPSPEQVNAYVKTGKEGTGMENGNHPLAHDEKYCSSCGKQIKKEAIMCVNCGVQQQGAHIGGGEQKSWLVTVLLSFFLGYLGIDRFYTGHTMLGIIKLITVGGCGIWWFIDFILYLIGAVKDSEGRPLKK